MFNRPSELVNQQIRSGATTTFRAISTQKAINLGPRVQERHSHAGGNPENACLGSVSRCERRAPTGFSEFTNEVQHPEKVLPWDESTNNLPSPTGIPLSGECLVE